MFARAFASSSSSAIAVAAVRLCCCCCYLLVLLPLLLLLLLLLPRLLLRLLLVLLLRLLLVLLGVFIVPLLSRNNSFRSFASKGFPSECSESVCVCACPQKTLHLRGVFRKRRLTNTPRRHRLADGQISSLYTPPPSFSSFGAASVMVCCSARPASSSAPSVLPEDRIGRKYNIHS